MRNPKNIFDISRKERDQIIKSHAMAYHSPIGDIKGFNELLKQDYGITTTRKKVAQLLGYTSKEAYA